MKAAFLLIAAVLLSTTISGQSQPSPPTGKAAATIDLAGYWVSVVSEDWRWRMVTPLKGDAASVPINAEARKVVDAWDPAKDEAASLECKAYGAPAVMRIPGRLHITWQDDNTLKIETDAGTQTRLFHFHAQPPAKSAPSWQGFSAATWEGETQPPSGGIALGLGMGARPQRSRALQITTTQLRPGYLRKNGVPYSDQTVLKEYYDRFTEPNGDEWLTITTVVTDPVYLSIPFVTTTDFRREPDGSKFRPTPCSAR